MDDGAMTNLLLARAAQKKKKSDITQRRVSKVSQHLAPTAEDRACQEVKALAVSLTAGLRLLEQGGQADLAAGFFSARHPVHRDLFLAPSHGVFWKEMTPDAFGVYLVSDGSRSQHSPPYTPPHTPHHTPHTPHHMLTRINDDEQVGRDRPHAQLPSHRRICGSILCFSRNQRHSTRPPDQCNGLNRWNRPQGDSSPDFGTEFHVLRAARISALQFLL